MSDEGKNGERDLGVLFLVNLESDFVVLTGGKTLDILVRHLCNANLVVGPNFIIVKKL